MNRTPYQKRNKSPFVTLARNTTPDYAIQSFLKKRPMVLQDLVAVCRNHWKPDASVIEIVSGLHRLKLAGVIDDVIVPVTIGKGKKTKNVIEFRIHNHAYQESGNGTRQDVDHR